MVAGSGTAGSTTTPVEFTVPSTADNPTLAPELSATIGVVRLIVNVVGPKLPVVTFVRPGPSTNGTQAIETWLTSLNTAPPAEEPLARNLYRESISRSRLSHELDDYGIHSNILRVLEVDDVISHCTEPECHLLYEHYFEGYTSAEIAVRSKVNPITVRVRLMRLRNNIRVRRAKAS